MRYRSVIAVLATLSVIGAGCSTGDPGAEPGAPGSETATQTDDASALPRTGASPAPLAGRVVIIDPGHQLGNATFPDQINAPVDAGGFTKACNTTGTATDDGYPEATLVWQIAGLVRAGLERRGARVALTRTSNSAEQWGPCVDVRGRAGNPGAPGPTGDVKVSLHADGNLGAGARGFHVIVPDDGVVARGSARLGRILRDALRAGGVPVAGYVGDRGLDRRGDLGTLNLARIPSAMIELGNMRDADDAARMTTARGRQRYAAALVRGIVRYLA